MLKLLQITLYNVKWNKKGIRFLFVNVEGKQNVFKVRKLRIKRSIFIEMKEPNLSTCTYICT